MTDSMSLSDLKARVTKDPNDADAWCQMGFILLHGKETNEAKLMLERAITLNPKIIDAWAGLGVIAANKGELKTAEDLYKRAVKIDSKYNDGWFALARVYWGQTKYKDAVRALKNCNFETLQGKLMVLKELAIVYIQWRKLADAEKPLRQAIQLDPTDNEYKILLHKVLMEQKKNEKVNQAILLFREIPLGTMTLEELLRALDQSMQYNDFDIARDFGKRILEMDPENINGLFVKHWDLRMKYNFHNMRFYSAARVSTDAWELQKLDEELKKLGAVIQSIIGKDVVAKIKWTTLFDRYPLPGPYWL